MNKTIKSRIAVGVVGASLLVGGLSGLDGANEEIFLIVPVEEMRAEFWENAHQNPSQVIYTDDGESFIVSFDEDRIPEGLTNTESHDAEAIVQVKEDSPRFEERRRIDREQ